MERLCLKAHEVALLAIKLWGFTVLVALEAVSGTYFQNHVQLTSKVEFSGGGACDTGGGGGGFAGGDSMVNSTNGEGGTSFLGLTRSIRELSFLYPGSNSGHGSVILIPAIEGCGCDYRCVALDEYRSLVACICPEGLRLKPDNLTACECEYLEVFVV